MGDVERDGTVRLGGRGGEYTEPNQPDRNGYVGVDPMYANAANETDYPLEGDDSEDEAKDEKPAKKPAEKKESAPVAPSVPASPAS